MVRILLYFSITHRLLTRVICFEPTNRKAFRASAHTADYSKCRAILFIARWESRVNSTDRLAARIVHRCEC